MSQPIVYIDTSTIRKGRLDHLKKALVDLGAFVEANEPQLISYGFFVDVNRTHLTVVAVHPDSASPEFDMDVGATEFRKFADLIDLQRIEVYGQISGSAMERLHQKAQILGQGTVAVHDFYAGFAR